MKKQHGQVLIRNLVLFMCEKAKILRTQKFQESQAHHTPALRDHWQKMLAC